MEELVVKQIELGRSSWQKLQVLRISWMLTLLSVSLAFNLNRDWKLGIFWTLFRCVFILTVLALFWIGLRYRPAKAQGEQTSE